MRVEPIPSDDDPEAFAAWCREHDCRPTGSTRRAWCSRFGTFLRDAVAVATTITGDDVLLYEADLAEEVRSDALLVWSGSRRDDDDVGPDDSLIDRLLDVISGFDPQWSRAELRTFGRIRLGWVLEDWQWEQMNASK